MTNSEILCEDFEDIFNPQKAFVKYFKPIFLDDYTHSNRVENHLIERERENFRELYISQTTEVLARLIEESPELSVNKTFNTRQLAQNIAKKLADEVLKIL